MTPSRKKFLLRIDPALWDQINRWAALEFRSVNGQVEFLLQRAVEARFGKLRRGEGAPPPEPRD